METGAYSSNLSTKKSETVCLIPISHEFGRWYSLDGDQKPQSNGVYDRAPDTSFNQQSISILFLSFRMRFSDCMRLLVTAGGDTHLTEQFSYW